VVSVITEPERAMPAGGGELPPHLAQTLTHVDPEKLPPLPKKRSAASALPRVLVIVGLALAGAGGWYLYSRPAAVTAPPKGTHRVDPCASPVPITTAGGKRWVNAPFGEGAALLLLSGPLPDSSLREHYGIAMVVESDDHRSRIIGEDLDNLPAEIFACPK
jgi:hypothetical protein